MTGGRIDRYIFREVTVPYAISLAIFTFVLLGGRFIGLAEMVINKGVAAREVFGLLATLLPVFLLITLPLAFLLGVLLGFSRLSADSEIVAMKAAGISIYSLFRPVLLVALLTAAATAFFSISAEPRAKTAFRNQVFQIVQQRASVGLVPQVFISDFPGLVLYAKDIDQQQDLMKGVFISDQRLSQAPVTIFARRGRLISDATSQSLTMHLEEGDIHRYAPRSVKDTYQTIHFSTYDIQLKADQVEGSPRRRMKASEMDFQKLFEVAASTEVPKQRQEMLAEAHKRMVLAISPLLFALIAIPFGIRSHRSGRGGGFALGLGIFLIFHLALSFGSTLVIEQGWPALPTIWTAPTVFFILAFMLIRATALERPLLFATYRRARKKV